MSHCNYEIIQYVRTQPRHHSLIAVVSSARSSKTKGKLLKAASRVSCAVISTARPSRTAFASAMSLTPKGVAITTEPM